MTRRRERIKYPALEQQDEALMEQSPLPRLRHHSRRGTTRCSYLLPLPALSFLSVCLCFVAACLLRFHDDRVVGGIGKPRNMTDHRCCLRLNNVVSILVDVDR